MWFNFYVCTDVYCTGMNKNVMTRMSEMIGSWKNWFKTTEFVCQACWWQAPHLHQHRLNHLQDSTTSCRYLRALHPRVMDTIEMTKFVCRRLSFVSLLQRSIRGPLNLEDTGIVMQKSEWSQQSNHFAKEREDLPYHISSEKEERQPQIRRQNQTKFRR